MKIGILSVLIRTDIGITITDMTARITSLLKKSGIKQGQITVYTRHTTTGIVINECETRLLEDISAHFERLAPKDRKYLHDDLHLRNCAKDERKNGHAHLKALCIPSSQIIPVNESRMLLGKWQSVLFVDFDGEKEREIIVQWMGE